MSYDVPEQFRPRLCHIVKWPEFPGYGFNLHAEKGKAGQFIGQVDNGSPAQAGGLKEGDRIVEVNGSNIGSENHQQVVARIKAGGEETRLLVVDNDSDEWYKDQKKSVRGDLPEVLCLSASRDSAPHFTEPEPIAEPEPEPEVEVEPEAFQQIVSVSENGHDPEESIPAATTNGDSDRDYLFRPRHCHLKMMPHFQGYGFNLHAERDKPGQYIGLVDDGSPAQVAGLRVNDRIVEVNGVNVEGQDHPDVIARIKSVPQETRLLVVDRETDAYYREKGVTVHSDMPQVDTFATTVAQIEDTAAFEETAVIDGENGEETAADAVAAATEEEEDTEEIIATHDYEMVDAAVPPPQQLEEEEHEREVEAAVEEAVVSHEERVESFQEQQPEEEPVNGINRVSTPEPPAPEPEPEFAVAPTPAPVTSYPAPTPAPAPTSQSDLGGLELNLSVAEMKERLKARKKQDPRASKLSFEQKFKDFQRM